VGGRRWAKFAKYLHRANIPIQVIASQRLESKSHWSNDILEYIENIDYIPSNYPLILSTNPNTIWQKLRYRLALLREKYFAKGNYYDLSKYWKKNLVKLVEHKINLGVNTIIYSTPPFRGAYFISELKKDYPEVQFIIDYRDPWTNNLTGFGFDNLSQQNLQFEKEMESKVVQRFDKIMAVSSEINDYLMEAYQVSQHKFFTLKNGFDPDERVEGRVVNKLKISFIGTFYQKAEHVLSEFCIAVRELETDHPQLFDKVEFCFFGQKPNFFDEYIAGIKSITHRGMIPLENAAQQIADSAACMLFLADDTNYSFSTKFYEYASNRKPIFVFSKPGATMEFVEKENIGIGFRLGDIKSNLEKTLKKIINNDIKFNPAFRTEEFEIKQLTKELLSIIKK
jgi:hypothetical protein